MVSEADLSRRKIVLVYFFAKLPQMRFIALLQHRSASEEAALLTAWGPISFQGGSRTAPTEALARLAVPTQEHN